MFKASAWNNALLCFPELSAGTVSVTGAYPALVRPDRKVKTSKG